ncbi:MAG: cysteine desulfurase [Flavobacteriales bacterium]|nr:cysteine desulfurase [Flavobacteriales bacterium]
MKTNIVTYAPNAPIWQAYRNDFSILDRDVNNKPLAYLDNAASSQKPNKVIKAIVDYYEQMNANVHRGVHTLSQLSTDAFEEARKTVQFFINASSEREIVFTKGTTNAINLVAYSFGRTEIHPGDEVLISALEHHSNIVPWQMICQDKGAKLKVLPINEQGELCLDQLPSLINKKTRIVAISHVSNSLGTINPIRQIIDMAHQQDIPVLIDGAQAVPHLSVDVQALDCDFYCFSGHKMLAPTGIGVLYGKDKWLNKLTPFEGGGEMIKSVGFEHTTYNDIPFKFEAGTPHIEGVLGLAKAIEYMLDIGLKSIKAREMYLYQLAYERLAAIPGFKMIGTAKEKAPVLSFLIDNLHPYDIGVLLDKQGVAVRTGHHCTQPVMHFFNIPGTIRASFSFYNNEDDILQLDAALQKAIKLLS